MHFFFETLNLNVKASTTNKNNQVYKDYNGIKDVLEM
jgi:hypothetical protein